MIFVWNQYMHPYWMGGVIGGPFPAFREKFSAFPVFRHFFGAFPPFRHTYNAPSYCLSIWR